MAKETGSEVNILEEYRWDRLVEKEGVELKNFYRKLLLELGTTGDGKIREIYTNANSNIDEPKNLDKIVKSIDELDWYSAKEEGLGNLYEGLLEKNANEKKSGAGQYFTPRALINIIVDLIDPQAGEICNDPAMESFGKRNMLTEEHFKDFIKAYTAEDRNEVEDERWNKFTREEIKAKEYSLDLGLIKDDSIVDYEDLPDPIESAEDAVAKLEEATDLLIGVIRELKLLEGDR